MLGGTDLGLLLSQNAFCRLMVPFRAWTVTYTRRMLSILGKRELRLHSESHVLRCTVNDNQRLSILTYSPICTDVHANL